MLMLVSHYALGKCNDVNCARAYHNFHTVQHEQGRCWYGMHAIDVAISHCVCRMQMFIKIEKHKSEAVCELD